MKKISLVIILLLIIASANAQSHDIIWQNSFGGTLFEEANAACLATDNGYVIGGGTFSNDGDVTGNHGNRDYWVIKLNAQGILQWQKCLGGTKNDRLYGINSTSDGGVVASGHAVSINGNVSGHHNSGWRADGWVVKLDSIGNLQWQKCLGGSDSEVMQYAEETLDGGYIVAGKTHSNDGDVTGYQGQGDCWIVKLDSVGNIQWQTAFGGSNIEGAKMIIQLADSSYIFTGYSNSSDGDLTFNHGGDDVWVVKLDTDGNMEWEKSYGGSGTDHSSCIAQSINGGYTISALSYSDDGDVSGGHGDFDAWIFELDSSGNLIWQNCYGGSESDQAKWLSKTADGGNIITGVTGSYDGDVTGNHGGYDCWVIKTDSIGNLQWQQCYGGSGYEHGRALFQSPTGNHIVASWSTSNDGDVSGNHGDVDFWAFEIESNIVPPIGVVGSISGQDSICEGTLSETYSIEPIVNATAYTWTLDPDVADSIITNDTAATIYFEQGTSGYTTLSVFGSNIGGNSDTAYFGINIIAQPTSNAGSDTTICENSSHMLNGSATSYHHIYWNTFGDGSFDDPFLLNATYTPGSEDVINGSVDLVMFAFANSPCLGEVGDTLNLTIISLPDVYAGEDDSVCAGYSYLLSGVGDNYSSIIWSTSGDGTLENSTQLSTYYFPGPNDIGFGSVNLVLTASANYPCDEFISDTLVLSIIEIPNQPHTPQGPTVIILDTCSITEYFTDTVENADSYQWYLDPLDAGAISGIGTNAIVNWNSSYTGIVAYIYVQALNICGETFSDSLIVDISPVGFLNENTSSEIIISPNPSNRIFNVTIKGLGGYAELYVSNTSGKILRNKSFNITKNVYKFSLDLNDAPSGIYYVRIVFENQKHFDNMIILSKD